MTTSITALAIASTLALTPFASAQTATTTTAADGTTTSVSTTTSIGTISEIGADTLVIRSETSPDPIRYRFSKSTTYVDETGNPVSMETVHSGLPVTVYYAREGGQMMANRVVVRKQTSTEPTIVERNTTITKPPVVVEKPVYVDRVVEKPVIVEKKVIVPVEKKVYVDRVVEKPVIVEKKVIVAVPVATPAMVEETTTTTTTTEKK